MREPGLAAYESDLSIAYRRQGQIVVQRGERERGLELVREGLACAETLARAQPTNALLARQLLLARFELGNLLQGEAEIAEARALFELARADAARSSRADPGNDLAQRDLVLVHLHAALVEARAGAWEDALDLCEQALPVARKRAEHAQDWTPQFELAQLHLGLGRAHLELGRRLEGGAALGQAAGLLEKLGEPPRTETSMCRYYAQTAHRLGSLLRIHAERDADAPDPARLAPARRWLEKAGAAFRMLDEEGQAFPGDRADHARLRAELASLELLDGQ